MGHKGKAVVVRKSTGITGNALENVALPNNGYINGDPDDREKSSGAPEAQISPLAAQIGASAPLESILRLRSVRATYALTG